MGMMGLAYALITAVMWPSVTYLVPEGKLGTAYGLMTLIQNVGLAGFNFLIGWANDHADALGDLDLRFLHAGRIKQLRTRAAWAGAALAVLLLATIAGLAYTGTLNRLLYRPPSLQWIVIPGDRFLMGSTPDEVAAADAIDAAENADQADLLGHDFGGEQPAHWVELSPYQIMRYEVTRAEYHQCQRAGVCDATSPPLSVTGVDGALPVTNCNPAIASRSTTMACERGA